MTTNASIQQLRDALALCNKKYGYQLDFRRIEPKGKRVIFTLKSKSGVRGSRNAVSGRKMPCASWEAHGQFFDLLFDTVGEDVFIVSRGVKITAADGNWKEIRLGLHSKMSDFSNK